MNAISGFPRAMHYSSSNIREDQEHQGVEYELTDFMLLADIEEAHSLKSFQQQWSGIDAPSSIDSDNASSGGNDASTASSMIDPPDASSADEEENESQRLLDLIDSDLIDSTIAEESEKYSVYNNFDDLFSAIRDSWSESDKKPAHYYDFSTVVGNNDGGCEEEEQRSRISRKNTTGDAYDLEKNGSASNSRTMDEYGIVGMSGANDDNMMQDLLGAEVEAQKIMAEDEDYQSIALAVSDDADNTQILKDLIVKCLVRNIKKDDQVVKYGSGVGRDPSQCGECLVESELFKVPRDPSISSRSSINQNHKPQPIKGQNIDRLSLPRDPSISMSVDDDDDSRNDQDDASPRDPSISSQGDIISSVTVRKATRYMTQRDPPEDNNMIEISNLAKPRQQNFQHGMWSQRSANQQPPCLDRDPPEDNITAISNPPKPQQQNFQHDMGTHSSFVSLPHVTTSMSSCTQPPRPDGPRYQSPSQPFSVNGSYCNTPQGKRSQPFRPSSNTMACSPKQQQCQSPRPEMLRHTNPTLPTSSHNNNGNFNIHQPSPIFSAPPFVNKSRTSLGQNRSHYFMGNNVGRFHTLHQDCGPQYHNEQHRNRADRPAPASQTRLSAECLLRRRRYKELLLERRQQQQQQQQQSVQKNYVAVARRFGVAI